MSVEKSLSIVLQAVVSSAVLLACACNSLPPIYRNPGFSLSKKTSQPASTGTVARKGPGSNLVTLGTGDRRSAQGRYEQCATDGVRARIIRQANGARVVYAYGWDTREAELFQGKRVEVTGRIRWLHGGLNPADFRVESVLPLPHFVRVIGIQRIRYYSGDAFGRLSGDCLK